MADSNNSRIVAVLPAFNESASIADVVRAILPIASVIVIDDGSSDATASLARAAGAEVVSHGTNSGYDRALETGLMRALQLGYEYAVTLDADGQHRAATIKDFADELFQGADLVIGIRNRMQRWAEWLFAVVANTVWGIRDPLCGMKGYRLALLRRVDRFDSYGSVGTEFSIRAVRSGCVIRQVPVVTLPRIGRSRFGDGFRANRQILRAIWFGIFYARRFSR